MARLQTLQPLTPAEEFISKLSKTPGGLLPFPVIDKRRKKARPSPREATRRSRRVAGLPASSTEGLCPPPPHLKKQVMRALDMDVPEGLHERVRFDQKTLDDYARRFLQPYAPQVMALAALFSLTPPTGVESDECVA